MIHTLVVIAGVSAFIYLLCKQASIQVWAISWALVSGLIWRYGEPSMVMTAVLGIVFAIMVFSAITPLRRLLFSRLLFNLIKRSMPAMSNTEREALEAGTVSWEGDLFSGAPDLSKLRQLPTVQLREDEQAFLDGPVDELCRMIDDWDITHNLTDLPPNMWQFIKKNKFFGMIIPKEYGGLELSATAQMIALVKLYGRSVGVATTVSVPNSLGPAELLLKYGTEQQKNYYLPRLADGREIPCFGLTGPNAGSDAASIPDRGIVCKQMHNGQETLGIKLTFNKRYITLGPVATVIGLAFRLFDPEGLLGKGNDLGITVGLIPAQTPGIIQGRRHFPLNTAFMNGPLQGNDVFIPMDYIIGGESMVGKGWKMLMECLSAGRAISLPSSASGGSQVVALASGAYARVRRQFNQAIAKFEGIEEPLARIAATAYLNDSALSLAAAAIDHGEKPSVAGAILKYQTTERSRALSMDGMDIHGGKGICLGPNNYLGRGYQSAPIGITVEGANILTRSLIIFGQGAIRCHPYVYPEMLSVRNNDLVQLDKNFFGHMSFILANLAKSLVFGFTDGWGLKAPVSPAKRYYQLLYRYSANLAFLADYSMMIMGGALKRREMISARLGDMLSTLYLTSGVLKRFHQDGEPIEDMPVIDYTCQMLLNECEEAMAGVIHNFRPKWAGFLLRLLVMPLGRRRHQPSDKLAHTLAKLMITPNPSRDRLTRYAFKEAGVNCPVGRLEAAFVKICAVEDVEKKLLKAAKKHKFSGLTMFELIEEGLANEVITQDEAQALNEAEILRQEVIAVDDFSDEELRRTVKTKKAAVAVKEGE